MEKNNENLVLFRVICLFVEKKNLASLGHQCGFFCYLFISSRVFLGQIQVNPKSERLLRNHRTQVSHPLVAHWDLRFCFAFLPSCIKTSFFAGPKT